MIISLENIPAVYDTTFTEKDGAIIITLWMGITRSEKNPGRVNLFIPTDIDFS